MKAKPASFILAALALVVFDTAVSCADWEIGAKAGYDSNVNRSINNGKGDTLFTGYASFTREPGRERQLDWTLAVVLEGTAYTRINDLNYVAGTFAPGVTYSFNPVWSVNVSPFLQVRGVNDSDQSAWAFGGKASLRQQWKKDFYTGQYYMYTDSRANTDTYSFTENALGFIVGANWSPSFFTEATYEYSRGDSFRTLGSSTAIPPGRGANRRFSSAFNEDVIQEKVDRNAVGISAGYDFSKSLFGVVGYTYAKAGGDLGTSIFHYVYAGLGYRF